MEKRQIRQNYPTWTITFDTPVVERVMAGIELKSKQIEVRDIVDNPAEKTVTVNTSRNVRFVLWRGDDYDKIGNWTNQDVESRLRELVSKGAKE